VPTTAPAPTTPDQTTPVLASPKPAWRFARERKLGRLARRLLPVAEAEIPVAVAILGPETVLAATRADAWALACLERAAEADDGSEIQGAWVLLAASRPTRVRRVVHGPRAGRTGRRGESRRGRTVRI